MHAEVEIADRHSARADRLLSVLTAAWSRALPHAGAWAGAAIALWLILPMLSDGLPAGDDTIAHLIRAEYGLEHFARHARIDGWQPTFALGYQQFLFVGPLFTWAVGLVDLLTLGHLSTVVAFKLVVVGSFVALPPAVAYLARSFGLSRRAAGAGAVLSLCLSSPFGGVGFDGLFLPGLVLHQLGAVLFCVALGSALRLLREPSARRVVKTAVAVALLIVAHGVSMILLGFLLLVVVGLVLLQPALPVARAGGDATGDGVDDAFVDTEPFVGRARVLGLGALAASFALALSLAAFALLPVAAHRDLSGPLFMSPHFPFGTRLSDLWHGRYLLRPGVAAFVPAGWAFALTKVRPRRPFALALVLAPAAFLLLGELFHAVAPDNSFGRQIPNRGLGYAAVLGVLPLAALLAWVGGRVSERFGDAAAVGLAALFVLVPLGSYRELARPLEPVPLLHDVAAQLRSLVPAGARFAMEHDNQLADEFAFTGVPNPEHWIARESGRNMLNHFNLESSSTWEPALTPGALVGRPPDEAADDLARFGVTHLLLLDTQRTGPLWQSPRLSLAWSSSTAAILAVQPRPGQPSPASLLATAAPATARLASADPEHLRIEVDAERPTAATVAVAWSPKWHARVDGRPVPLGHTDEGLLAVRLPAGGSTLALDFRSDVWDRLGVAVTALTATGLALWSLRRRRRLTTAGGRG